MNQVIIFTFSYLLWCMVHVEREYWAMSKKSIEHLHIGIHCPGNTRSFP